MPNASRTLARSLASSGRNRSASTPGGITTPATGRRGGADEFARGVVARGHDARGGVDGARAEVARARDPTGNGHLRAVHDENVWRRAQAGTELPERQPRIEEDHPGPHLPRDRVDAARERRSGEELRLAGANHTERSVRVPTLVARVVGREDRGLPRWQPPPQLVQIRLDPADLRWEVVRDEQRAQGTVTRRRARARARPRTTPAPR